MNSYSGAPNVAIQYLNDAMNMTVTASAEHGEITEVHFSRNNELNISFY